MPARLSRDDARILRRSDRDPVTVEDWSRLVLLVDKPGGLSSFDVIRRLRRIAPLRKIGHAGTLDPMATGLLICLAGRATKLMESFMGEDKVYTGTVRLGEVTPSYDADTEVVERTDASHVKIDDVRDAASKFMGEIVQQTPAYSAVKVGGERLYKKARRGEDVKRPPRIVSVERFDITEMDGADVRFEVACSKGTYIRALAHDIGQELGVGGHLVALRRTKSGPISVDDAVPLEELLDRLSGGGPE